MIVFCCVFIIKCLEGIYDRFDFVFEKCTDLEDSSILDIGSGTGAYCIEFASRNAKKVVGIDIAPSMVDYSISECKKFGVSENVSLFAVIYWIIIFLKSLIISSLWDFLIILMLMIANCYLEKLQN